MDAGFRGQWVICDRQSWGLPVPRFGNSSDTRCQQDGARHAVPRRRQKAVRALDAEGCFCPAVGVCRRACHVFLPLLAWLFLQGCPSLGRPDSSEAPGRGHWMQHVPSCLLLLPLILYLPFHKGEVRIQFRPALSVVPFLCSLPHLTRCDFLYLW